MADKTAQSGGIGFLGMLTILFIGLKLTNNIDWTWTWVLSPLWIPFAVLFGLVIIYWILSTIVEQLVK